MSAIGIRDDALTAFDALLQLDDDLLGKADLFVEMDQPLAPDRNFGRTRIDAAEVVLSFGFGRATIKHCDLPAPSCGAGLPAARDEAMFSKG